MSYNKDNIVFNKITKPHTKFNIHNKNGFYKIDCPDCNIFYAGQSKKKRSERFVQHRNAFLNPKDVYKRQTLTRWG